MNKKRRRKGNPRNDAEDFQMMNIDFNPPPSVPIATSTSTIINISQWEIDGDWIHGASSLAPIEDPTAVAAPSATDSTTQATSDYNVEFEPTFYEDIISEHNPSPFYEDIIPEHHDPSPSAKRSFIGVCYFCLTTINCSSQSCTFHFLG